MNIFLRHGDIARDIVTRCVGDEIRRERDHAGLTRAQLVAKLPSDIHSQTLATYEQGTRQCTMARFIEICRALDQSAPAVLRLALLRAHVDLEEIPVRVDLAAVLRDTREETRPLRNWARKRLAIIADGSTTAVLDAGAVAELAVFFGYTTAELQDYLYVFRA